MKTNIILGSYNGEQYIEQQIQSFFKQTILPDRLIISDDASSDGTVKIVKKLSRISPFPIDIFNNEKNMGYTANFENLLKMADGDIIFFSDQDDSWFPEKIEIVTGEFKKSDKIMLVINDMILADGKLNPSPFTQLTNIRKIGMSDETFVAGCAVAIRKEWKSIVLPFPENYEGHDNWISRLAAISGSRLIIEKPLQLYRRHGSNVSQSYASKTEKMNQFSAALTHGLQSAENGWRKELERLRVTRDRIIERREGLVFLNLPMGYEKIIELSNRNIGIYQKRISNSKKNKLNRFLPLCKMFIKGDYQIFTGYKSFIKDLIR